MKLQVLKALKQSKHQYISGEELSNQLGVSRTAVWKAISALREEGYVVHSSPRKGYCLHISPDVISAEEIQQGLQTQCFGKHIDYAKKVSSTNQIAKQKATLGCPEGTVVIAEQQTSGRGRLGRKWVSPPETGIWMSILLRPRISPAKAPFITIMAALATVRGIEEVTGIRASIKWPNDILIEKRKVCGILTEIHAEMEQIHYIVAGIGINVNQHAEDFPSEISDTAGSIAMVTGKSVQRREIAIKVLEHFEKLYVAKDALSTQKLIEEYKRYSLTLGQQIKVIWQDEILEGKAIGLTDTGELLVQKEDGQKITVFSGEVSVRGIGGYV